MLAAWSNTKYTGVLCFLYTLSIITDTTEAYTKCGINCERPVPLTEEHLCSPGHNKVFCGHFSLFLFAQAI